MKKKTKGENGNRINVKKKSCSVEIKKVMS